LLGGNRKQFARNKVIVTKFMRFTIFENFKVSVFYWITVFSVLIAGPVQSANWNVKPIDKDGLKQLEKRRVSSDFPHYATNLRISCSTSKGKEFQSTVRAGWTNDFFWGSQISKNSAKTWIGERQNRNIFRIRVSEASDKWRDQPNWITFVIRGKDLTEQLISGISGEYRSSGSYWRRCDLKAGSSLRDYAGITKSSNADRLAYLERLKRELNVLTMAQNVNVVQRTDFGVSVDFLFDFEKLLVTAETQLAEYKGKKEAEVATSTPDRSQPNSLNLIQQSKPNGHVSRGKKRSV